MWNICLGLYISIIRYILSSQPHQIYLIFPATVVYLLSHSLVPRHCIHHLSTCSVVTMSSLLYKTSSWITCSRERLSCAFWLRIEIALVMFLADRTVFDFFFGAISIAAGPHLVTWNKSRTSVRSRILGNSLICRSSSSLIFFDIFLTEAQSCFMKVQMVSDLSSGLCIAMSKNCPSNAIACTTSPCEKHSSTMWSNKFRMFTILKLCPLSA